MDIPNAASTQNANMFQDNILCAELFEARDIQVLSTKMPIQPGQMPSPQMLQINEVPSEHETRAIGALGSAIASCKTLRAAAGYPTSASEDILEARTRKLRQGLYNGEIPYAVYNYGLAQALRKHTDFMVQGK